jgi:hypothetical protein
MAMQIDHIHMGSANHYESVYRIMMETGLGHYDGGTMGAHQADLAPPGAVGHKAVPLGGEVYIEIETIVDPFGTEDPKSHPWWYTKAVAKGDIFSGLCLRVDTMEELAEVAKRHNTVIVPVPGTRLRPDGPMVKFWETPSAGVAWAKGLPPWYCWEDRMNVHPSGQPIVAAPHQVNPLGVAWLEMGGTESQMADWLGVPPSTFLMRFNGKPLLGLYAVGVKTDKGEVVIRRRPATDV